MRYILNISTSKSNFQSFSVVKLTPPTKHLYLRYFLEWKWIIVLTKGSTNSVISKVLCVKHGAPKKECNHPGYTQIGLQKVRFHQWLLLMLIYVVYWISSLMTIFLLFVKEVFARSALCRKLPAIQATATKLKWEAISQWYCWWC